MLSEKTHYLGTRKDAFRIHTRITKADFNVTPEHSFNSKQVEQVEQFMRFHNPPRLGTPIDAIIVPGTSPRIDAVSFGMRADAASEYAKRFPDSSLVISGMRPDISRATDEEKAPGYSEAKVVSEAIIERGVDQARIKLEEAAKHTGENIVFSLDLLYGPDGELRTKPTSVLFIVGSSYFGRRVELYMKRELRLRGLEDRVKYYIYDADVQEDFDREKAGTQAQHLSQDAQIRKESIIFREAMRVSAYRAAGQI